MCNHNSLRVLHSGTLAATAGGPAMSTYLALYGLRQRGVDAEIIQFPLAVGDELRGTEVPVHYASSPLGTPLQIAPKLCSEIRTLGSYDVYHAQGVWQWNTYALAAAARREGKPYLISPRGMLYPQDIRKSNSFFKHLSLRWRLLSDLNQAACIHATCEEEMHHCRQLGVTAPVCIIPNPVEIKEYLSPQIDGIRRIGYLGRVSRRKNIHGLVRAYLELGELVQGTELLIIGDGDRLYMDELKQLAAQVQHGSVRFTGFLNGEEKDRALASCSVLAMPSEFENLGNVVLEGLVRCIPCIATTGAPWEELNTEHCGWQVKYSPKAIKEAVRQALTTSDGELAEMGRRGRLLMERRYSVEAVAEQFHAVYNWVSGRGDRPASVIL